MKVTQRKMRANYIKPQPPWWDSDCEETKVIKNRWLNNYRGSGSQRELDLYKVFRKSLEIFVNINRTHLSQNIGMICVQVWGIHLNFGIN